MTQSQNTRMVGRKYEDLAAAYLRSKDYMILEHSYRTRMGEIDLIALDADTLVFVEVKYRSYRRMGGPAAAVDHRKQHVIMRVAQQYLISHGYREDTPSRFDVVAICGDEIIHYENAFGGM